MKGLFTMTCRYSDINQHDALYKIARDYPGGMEALAQRMGKSVPVMYNKFRPGIATHYVSFEEATEAIELCVQAGVKDAIAPAKAFAWRLGYVLMPVPQIDGLPNEDLAQQVCKTVKEFGEVASCIYESLATDNDITQAELDRFELEFQEATAAMFELRARVQERAAAGKGKG
jgi:hypothetical protein